MTYTLVADGGSDRVLLPILTWSLKRQGVAPVVEQWADLSRIPRARSLIRRVETTLDLYPCDVLFIHRDAEGQPALTRRAEINSDWGLSPIPHVPVVPVRMTEAWLLMEETPIRCAAGNPNGQTNLQLPELRRLEDLPDPKRVLHEALIAASGLGNRRRSRLPVAERVHRIPAYIDDYSKLNVLPAFRQLQEDIATVVQRLQP